MTDPTVTELATHLSELEAASILAALKDAGIPGVVVGGNLAAAWPEFPRWVSITVRREDLTRAREIVDTLRRDAKAIDWDEIDVGKMEDDQTDKGDKAPQ